MSLRKDLIAHAKIWYFIITFHRIQYVRKKIHHLNCCVGLHGENGTVVLDLLSDFSKSWQVRLIYKPIGCTHSQHAHCLAIWSLYISVFTNTRK